jgi:L-iditol 2-dehydrogenase
VASNLHRVPEGLDDAASAFLDPLASVLHGWSRLSNPSGRLLVYGSGALAWLWAAVASRRGMDVAVAGRRPERAAVADRFGARFFDVSPGSDALAAAGLFDAAVDATGDREVWERLPGLVRPGGQVLLFGGCAPGATATFDAERLHYGEMAVIGSFHYSPAEARAALEALASGAVDPRPLITARGTLSDLPRFLEDQKRGAGIRYAVGAAA